MACAQPLQAIFLPCILSLAAHTPTPLPATPAPTPAPTTTPSVKKIAYTPGLEDTQCNNRVEPTQFSAWCQANPTFSNCANGEYHFKWLSLQECKDYCTAKDTCTMFSYTNNSVLTDCYECDSSGTKKDSHHGTVVYAKIGE